MNPVYYQKKSTIQNKENKANRNPYRIENANNMKAEELITAIRDKIQQHIINSIDQERS